MSKFMAKDKNIKNKKTLLQKLRYKYRLIILNEDTFEQKTSLRLSRMNLYVLGSVFFLLVVVFVTAVIAFTPLKYYMPGVGSVDVRTQLIEVEMLTDSLERELDKRNLWLHNFQQVLTGELDSAFFMSNMKPEVDIENVDLTELSENEASFRDEVKDQMETEALIGDSYSSRSEDSDYYPLRFMPPTDGLVISEYDLAKGHYGIDIAGEAEADILAAESGVVLTADWNPETGYVIAIQHKNDAVSFYKHNAILFKKVGSFVNKGDVIALMGNTGHLTDGPHLHFEIWQNGKSLNPLNYIDIKKIN